MKRTVALASFLASGFLALGLSACNGSASPSTPNVSFTPLPFLVPGSTAHYAGTFSEVVTYASPSAKQPNSTGVYKTADVETVSAAPSSAPAPFDVHRRITYTVTTVPSSGIQLQQRVIDSFESSTVTATSQTIAQASVTTKTSGIDQTANRVEGNGPYKYSNDSTTTYATPRILFVFPFVAGSTNVPLARTVTDVQRSANGAGEVYSDRNTTSKYEDSGAFSETGSIASDETTRVKANANGTAVVANSGTSLFRETTSLPIEQDGAFHIPVDRVVNGVSTSYMAADWYPGNAAPPSPLASTAETVKGPSSVPPRCGVSGHTAGVEEVDSSSATVDVVSGSYTTGRTQTFVSDGSIVCRITYSKVEAHSVETGLPVSTTTDTFAEGLTAQSAGRNESHRP